VVYQVRLTCFLHAWKREPSAWKESKEGNHLGPFGHGPGINGYCCLLCTSWPAAILSVYFFFGKLTLLLLAARGMDVKKGAGCHGDFK